MTGITRSAAAKIIAEHFDTSAVHVGGTYDTYTVEDDTGRKWKVVSDASIQCQSRGERTASRLYAVEVVSPIHALLLLGLRISCVPLSLQHTAHFCSASSSEKDDD